MSESRQHQSHLFTVRLWAEAIDEGMAEWRGKVQHVISGETHYFRDWNDLTVHLQAMSSQREAGQRGATVAPEHGG